MNREIAGDIRFFLATLLLGMAAALCYDGLRVWRRLHKQTLFTVSVQDFIFWFLLGLAGFRLMYRHNAGTLRLFVLIGILLGAMAYWVTIGRFFVKYCVKLLEILSFPVRKGLLFLQKQGKLISRTKKQVREKKLHGRKGALATEKRKKKNGPQAAPAGRTGDVRTVDLQQRRSCKKREVASGKEGVL